MFRIHFYKKSETLIKGANVWIPTHGFVTINSDYYMNINIFIKNKHYFYGKYRFNDVPHYTIVN